MGQLLKYFVYRHATLAESEYDFSVRLGFCTLSVRMVDALSRGKNETDFMEAVRRYCAEIEYSEDNVVALLEEMYNKAIALLESGRYDEAINEFETIIDYKDCA